MLEQGEGEKTRMGPRPPNYAWNVEFKKAIEGPTHF